MQTAIKLPGSEMDPGSSLSGEDVNNNIWKCPRCVPGLVDLQFDMTRVREAEGRFQDIAIVNPQKSLELQARFLEALSDLTKHVNTIEQELVFAERQVRDIKSRLVLEEIPLYLKSKGVSSSADTREAALEGNKDYSDALDRLACIKAFSQLLKNTASDINRAYYSAKSVVNVFQFDSFNQGKDRINSSGMNGMDD